jgi:hypothetical protein
MTCGAVIYSLEAPDRAGRLANVTANRESLADYEKKSACFGSLIGRYANRIAGARFSLDGHQVALPRNDGGSLKRAPSRVRLAFGTGEFPGLEPGITRLPRSDVPAESSKRRKTRERSRTNDSQPE